MLKILCYLTLFALIAQPAALFPQVAVTERLFLSLAVMAIVAFVVSRIMRGRPLGKVPQRKYVYALVGVYALSIAQTGWLGGAVDMLLTWSKIAIVFTLVVDVGESVRDVRRLLQTVVLAVVVLTVAGWNIYLNIPELLHNQGRLESVGNYNLSNSFALALTVASALVFALLGTTRRAFGKLVYVLLLSAFAVTCVYTKSRGGNLGLAVAILASILLSPWIRSRMAKGLLVAGVITIMVSVSVPLILARGDVSGYFGGDDSAGDRIQVWEAGLRMIKDHPLLGVGYKQFPEHLDDYGVDQKLLAHNTLLSVTAETGLFGGLLFVMMILTSLMSLWRVWRRTLRDPSQQELAALAEGVMIGLVAFMVNTSFSVKDADPMLWSLLGIAGSVVVVHRRLAAADAAGAAVLAQPAQDGPGQTVGYIDSGTDQWRPRGSV